jgi:hypothetical protein
LSRDLIQASPAVAAASTAAAVVTPGSAVDATAATTPTTTTTTMYDMDPGGGHATAAAATTASTSTSTSSRNTSVASSPVSVPSDLYSSCDDDDDDDASTEFEILQTYTRPQQQTTHALANSSSNKNNHRQSQQQHEHLRDLSSPQESLLTEGGTTTTSTSYSHVDASMATTKGYSTNADTMSVYTLGVESHKTTSSHWVDALTWSWGRNPCLVLEELVDMWDPEESPTANNHKDINNNKTKTRSSGGIQSGWFNNLGLPRWNISSSHGEEMRFSDCTNSVIRSSDSSSKSRNNNKRVLPSSGVAAAASSIFFSNMTACHTSSTSSSTPSQEGFERQVSAPAEQSREEEAVVGPYVEEEGGVTVPAQVIALGKDEFHAQQNAAAARRSASGVGAGGDRGIRMSPSDASTITTAYSLR